MDELKGDYTNNRYGDKSLSANEKVKAMMEAMAMTEEEARIMLVDAGEIEED